MAVVELDNVGKRFTVGIRKGWVRRERREVRAVDGISLSIEPGAMVGYIGPNGAGKSTTIKMLTGILVPSSGSVRVAGLDPNRERVTVARRIGVLFGQRTQLWWDLPLEDSFSLLRHVYRVPQDRFDANLAVFRELLALDELLPIPVRQLSLGQRMRGELAAVLLHDPAILFLDEPTIGLDPVSKEAVRSFLVELNCTRGTTVLLTTHDLVDVERLCERLVIIDHGKLIEDSTVAAIKQRYGTERTLVVDLEAPGPPLSVDGVRVTRVDGPRQWLQFHRDTWTAAALLERVATQAAVRDLSVEEPAIEDIVRAIYRGEASSSV
ncbi:MAG TPA: ATP-binding cassette domain-containing protein [Acidimicrobiales bacterium]|jgi:viologen exporter family transport system ATP-binding protein|nr:ATP-binding cassette domain-containing protein [Acidimicrobiales bacterium]